MSNNHLKYGNTTIEYSLEYSDRKTLGIRVHPDNKVQVIAPNGASEQKVKERLKTKAAWILKQQNFFLSFRPLTPPRQFVSGETHLYLGKQYRLKLYESENESVKLQGGNISVYVNDKSDKSRIEELLKQWYKSKADNHFNTLFKSNLSRSRAFIDKSPTLKFRWMKKRWGSCAPDGTINLNLELIKAPKKCIEYVIVHELCHLVHLNHSTSFYKLLAELYPDWVETKDRLERVMV